MNQHNCRKNRHPWVFLLSFLCIHFLPVDFSFSMDLIEAYNQAKEHDPLFGSLFYEHEAAKTQPAQGRSLLLPQIQASGVEAGYFYDSAPSNFFNFNSASLGVSIKQPIFNMPRYYEYKQKLINKDLGDAKFVSAEQDLLYRVAEAYFDALAAEDLLQLIQVEKTAVIEQLEQASRMLQAGAGTITDVHEAESRLDSIRAREIEAVNSRDIRMLAIKRIVGRQPLALLRLKDNAPVTHPEPDNLDYWIEKARNQHPLLQSQAHQIAYQEAELKKAQRAHWPSVEAFGGYNKTNTNNALQTRRISYGNAGLQLIIPIYSGGYMPAKIQESRALLEQARKRFDNAFGEITQKLSEAFLGIRASAAKIDALQTASRSAMDSVKSNKMSLTAGIRTIADILNAERDLEDIRIRLMKTRYESLMHIVKLKYYAGTICEEDLKEINFRLQTPAAK